MFRVNLGTLLAPQPIMLLCEKIEADFWVILYHRPPPHFRSLVVTNQNVAYS